MSERAPPRPRNRRDGGPRVLAGPVRLLRAPRVARLAGPANPGNDRVVARDERTGLPARRGGARLEAGARRVPVAGTARPRAVRVAAGSLSRSGTDRGRDRRCRCSRSRSPGSRGSLLVHHRHGVVRRLAGVDGRVESLQSPPSHSHEGQLSQSGRTGPGRPRSRQRRGGAARAARRRASRTTRRPTRSCSCRRRPTRSCRAGAARPELLDGAALRQHVVRKAGHGRRRDGEPRG